MRVDTFHASLFPELQAINQRLHACNALIAQMDKRGATYKQGAALIDQLNTVAWQLSAFNYLGIGLAITAAPSDDPDTTQDTDNA